MIELISIQQIKKPAPLLVIKPRFADSFDGTIQMNTLRQNFHIVLITFFSLSSFWVCGPNSVVWPFKWKLFGNTITWYYLVFSSLRLYFFWILIFAYHAIEPKGWISDTKTLQSMERKLLDKDRWMKQKKKTNRMANTAVTGSYSPDSGGTHRFEVYICSVLARVRHCVNPAKDRQMAPTKRVQGPLWPFPSLIPSA